MTKPRPRESAPTVRISAPKLRFPGFGNNHVSENSWRTFTGRVFVMRPSTRLEKVSTVGLPRRLPKLGRYCTIHPLNSRKTDIFFAENSDNLEFEISNIENLKISNFVFSVLAGQKPVSGEVIGTKG